VALTIESDNAPGSSVAPVSSDASDVWIWDIARNTTTRLSTSGQATSPVWSSDSRRVCYRSGSEVLCQPADGSGRTQVLAKFPEPRNPRAISPDGNYLISTTSAADGDIYITTIGDPSTTRALFQTPYNEAAAVLSPDGKWIAYHSNESGQFEVYVRPFPDVDTGKQQVSPEGGSEPRWSNDGRELFYVLGGGNLPRLVWSAAIQTGAGLRADKPKLLAKFSSDLSLAYDVAADGRFLFHQPSSMARAEPSQIVVVDHWFDELRARVPIAGR
jgi:serine/threonine-protein kinase